MTTLITKYNQGGTGATNVSGTIKTATITVA